MPGQSKTLEDLFEETLKDIYYAERKILTALPKLAKAANSDQLRAAFEKHIGETEGQVERLKQVFQMLKKPAKGKTCPAILGLVEEGEEVMEDFADSSALDAGLLAGAQAVEHYEMSRYGTMIAWAQQLGMKQAASLLEQTLAEEKATDAALSKLAPAALNKEAA
jgi:ferritin-like metal-binding protein YciE